MLLFLLGFATTIAIFFILIVIRLALEKREVVIRHKIIKENLAYIKSENERLASERTKLLDNILNDSKMRKMYSVIDNMLERLVKKQGIKIEIPDGIDLEMSCEALNCLVITIKGHIAETRALQRMLEESEGSSDTDRK